MANHVVEVLALVELETSSSQELEQLRLITLFHDICKLDVAEGQRVKNGNSHAVLGRRFAERYTGDEAVLTVIEYHDDVFAYWRSAKRNGDWEKSRRKVEKLVEKLKAVNGLGLFLKFLRADTLSGDKSMEPFDWFEICLMERSS